MKRTLSAKKQRRCFRCNRYSLFALTVLFAIAGTLMALQLASIWVEISSTTTTTTTPAAPAPPPGASGTLELFLDCVAARILVDRHARTEQPFPDDDSTVPYMVLPVTVEESLMVSLMCNLSVPVRRLVYVQNGAAATMTAFLDAATAALSFTQRLRVMRKPGNFGYAAALNMAARDFLTLPFDDAPFFFMANNDVLLPGGMMEKALPLFYNVSRAGRATVQALEAEVATEPNEHTPQRFRDVPLRSTDGRHALVTSRLLPDRIRYQPMAQRRTAFAGFYGEVHPSSSPNSAFWGMTRLALEVVGLFDENCYPAYFEDTDFGRRLELLGLKRFTVPGWEKTPLLHIGGGSRLVTDTGLHAPEHAAGMRAFMKGSTAIIRRSFWEDYAQMKYGAPGLGDASVMVEPNAQDGTPLDAFVINERRRCTIEQLEQRLIDKVRANPLIPDVEMAAMIWEAETAPGNPIHRRINGAKYYRNGTSLRLLTDCAALMGGGGQPLV